MTEQEPTAPPSGAVVSASEPASGTSGRVVTFQPLTEHTSITGLAARGGRFGCSDCGSRWTGYSTSHCANEETVSLSLLPLRDADARFLAERYPRLHECPVDSGGIPAKAFTDLRGTQPGLVKPGRLKVPLDSVVRSVMVEGTEVLKVLWSVVGPVPVDVVNVLLSDHPSVDDAVLVGLDVLVRTDLPAKSDVAMTSGVPTRLIIGNLLSRRQVSNARQVPSVSTRAAEPTLSRTRHGDSARATGDRLHGQILQVTALCHETFGGVTGFDKHRVGQWHAYDPSKDTRRCAHPSEVGLVLTSRGTWGTDGSGVDFETVFAS